MLTPEVNLGNVTGMGDIINTIHLWGGTRWGPRRQTVTRIHSRGRSQHKRTLETLPEASFQQLLLSLMSRYGPIKSGASISKLFVELSARIVIQKRDAVALPCGLYHQHWQSWQWAYTTDI